MDIIISNASSDPISQQIVNQIKSMIMDGVQVPKTAALFHTSFEFE